ncbi:MAG: polysaccharide biosynthesis/export family protein [Myxococcales bacterium]|nr:polysaccharide biosynthesis/export family protein [Myxococcales bacterium]
MSTETNQWARLASAGALFLVSLLVACTHPVDPEYLRLAGMVYDDANVGTLGEGDRFAIRVYQEPDMSAEYLVSRNGTISFPLIGDVQVFGRRCGDIEREITQRLADGLLRSPSVSCQVLEVNSLTIIVSGEVRGPGVFPFSANMSVVEAIARAQGLTPNAANDRVVVTRVMDGETRDIVVPFKQIVSGQAPNFPLWPNDTVFVPSYRLIP